MEKKVMKNRFTKVMVAILMITLIIGVIPCKIAVMAASDESISTIVMDKPPFQYYKSGKVKNKKNQSIQLKLKSSKANQITDDENWFKKNKLSMKQYEVPNPFADTFGNLPEKIDTYYEDLIITSAFYDESYIYCTYGSDFSEGYILNIYNAKSLKKVYSFDFTKYRYSPKYVKADYDYIQQKVNWATIKDNILYVSHGHDTYAKSSKQMNAYITAIDLSDMSILWRTNALVSNSYNFTLINDVIICGYGFTAEPDYLYQIDRNNGKVLKKSLLKSAPYYIIQKGKNLYVRTYNTDYVFGIN
ncbi:PQQ-binding-like beta-propeller repeat protein [Anaeromicropila herbilytica]|uniref:Uncharacterized protein n=1 Tax=Anaeromicropila herbilytica TaxID=2785025 RepID=A0A7R7ENT2_9FIRM|nr:hypothetical protein [Anaeromicropila herbilytica]BCN32291.1 hypothetical protein bsdtb5_35860 [Anaeromicropila herbilytica]